MLIEDCQKCPYHAEFENGRVFCEYGNNLSSHATDSNPRKGTVVLGCPREE